MPGSRAASPPTPEPRSAPLALLAIVALIAPGGLARAQTEAVSVSGPEDDAMVQRVRAELRVGGWQVIERPSDASARVEVGPEQLRVWVRGDAEPTAIPRGGPEDPAAALAAVEAVRARLRAPPAAAGEAEPPEAPGAESASRVTLVLGAGVGFTPGEIPPFVDTSLGAELRFFHRLYAELFGCFAVPESDLEQKRFDFGVWTTTFGAGLGFSFLEPTEPVALRAAIGLGATFVLLDGEEAYWAATPYARLAFSVRLIEHLSVRLDALIGAALPEIDLRFRAGWRSEFGLPRLSTTLGLEVDF